MLRQAMFVHRMGYNALLFDERHHGLSGGAITSMGFYERQDVEGAVIKAMQLDPQARPVVVWGVSMGAAAALMAAKETPGIDAVICDSTFRSIRDTTYHHLKLFLHLPKFPTAMTAILFFEHFTHFNADDFDLRPVVQQIGDRPILFVAGGKDNRMPPQIARELFALAQSGYKMFLEVPEARHGEAFRTNPKLYEEAVNEFLSRIQSSSMAAAGSPH
jgi:pimeloyl-ACP methyl ester carboxylesterase